MSKELTAEYFWNEEHKHRSPVGWSSTMQAFVLNNPRTEEEKRWAAMEKYAKHYASNQSSQLEEERDIYKELFLLTNSSLTKSFEMDKAIQSMDKKKCEELFKEWETMLKRRIELLALITQNQK